jgi:serine/threonine-protein kinase RsbW
MALPTTVKLVLSSEVRLIDLVHMAAEKVAHLGGFDADDALNIGLAVREGAINAIVHGNGSDPSLDVSVTIRTVDGGFSAHITDEGEGFDPDAAPDPTQGAALMASSGRGLLLMRAFVDEVVYSRRKKRGMEVTMTKRRTGNPDD